MNDYFPESLYFTNRNSSPESESDISLVFLIKKGKQGSQRWDHDTSAPDMFPGWANQDSQTVFILLFLEQDSILQVIRTFPRHSCCDSSEVHHRWAAILHVLHRRACLEFPAERVRHETRWENEGRGFSDGGDCKKKYTAARNRQSSSWTKVAFMLYQQVSLSSGSNGPGLSSWRSL